MSNIANIATFLNGRVTKLKSESKHGLDAQELIDSALVAIHQNPSLQTCTPQSLYISLKRAATLGLHPGTRGGCHLVPFRKRDGKWEAQLIIGYQGIIAMCTRGGGVKAVRARVVKEADEFDVLMGSEESIYHKPAFLDGETVRVYAIAELANGAQQFEVMTADQVRAIRDSSRAGNSGPWKNHFDEMAKKTVVMRLAKYLPVNVPYEQDFDTPKAISQDQNVVDLVPSERVQAKAITPGASTTSQDELRQKLLEETEQALPAYKRKDDE